MTRYADILRSPDDLPEQVLSWDKPVSLNDGEYWGQYQPTMSREDQEKWKAKKIGGEDPRVEVRKSVKGVQMVFIVRHSDVQMSMNGKAHLHRNQLVLLQQAIEEAQAALLDTSFRRGQRKSGEEPRMGAHMSSLLSQEDEEYILRWDSKKPERPPTWWNKDEPQEWIAKKETRKDPRVEVRKQTYGANILLVVRGEEVQLSLNGTARLQVGDFDEIRRAAIQAMEAFYDPSIQATSRIAVQ